MKQIRSRGSQVRNKYAGSQYVTQSGIHARMLSPREIEQLQEHIDRLHRGEVERPIRLEARQRI